MQVRYGNTTQPESGALYNTATNTFTPLHIAENPFCGAQTLLPDGQGVVVGGLFRITPKLLSTCVLTCSESNRMLYD